MTKKEIAAEKKRLAAEIAKLQAEILDARSKRFAYDVDEFIADARLCRESRRDWIDRLAKDKSGELLQLMKSDIAAARRSVIRHKFPLTLKQALAQWMPKTPHATRLRTFRKWL